MRLHCFNCPCLCCSLLRESGAARRAGLAAFAVPTEAFGFLQPWTSPSTASTSWSS